MQENDRLVYIKRISEHNDQYCLNERTKSKIYEQSGTDLLKPGRVHRFHASHGDASIALKSALLLCISSFSNHLLNCMINRLHVEERLKTVLEGGGCEINTEEGSLNIRIIDTEA